MKINLIPNIITPKTNNKYKNNHQSSPNLPFCAKLEQDVFEVQNSEKIFDSIFSYLKNTNHVVRSAGDNILAGETLSGEADEVFLKLSNNGIKTIIDLREKEDSRYRDKCEKYGMNYVLIPFTHVLDKDKTGFFEDGNTKVKQEVVDKLAQFLEITKEGNVYLGCHYGVDRTNFALVCDYIFNYDTNHYPPVIYPTNYTTRNAIKNANIELAKRIIKRLTPEQREKLKLDDNFEKNILKKRIWDIIDMNKGYFSGEITRLIEKKTGYQIIDY